MKSRRDRFKQFEIFLSRWPTTHAHFGVSMNDDLYWVSQKTMTCLTNHNSVLSSPQLLSDSSFLTAQLRTRFEQFIVFLCYIHTKKLSCFGSDIEFDMNDTFYMFKLSYYCIKRILVPEKI